ncbi:hypothetical protein BGW38_002388 [Lunasporangiospora selenospora]|uniref:CRAL-TRIO domain-containing protein n=1 Tax=Lunasporangiospora selenospora TaxID=979761 RepID=A0A9P6FSU7_9FUNG|nr:hypothetical protein BGW38_002388 [Lunasporangiospora selenospora]
MPKTDLPTPPGTGLVGKLTLDQKEYLKQMWAEIFHIMDASENNNSRQSFGTPVPPSTAEFAPPLPGSSTASSISSTGDSNSIKSKTATAATATVKKGWFGTSKGSSGPGSSGAADVPESTGVSALPRVNLADIGLTPEQLRPALWNNILGDHPDSLLLRFLRARKWNVTNGMTMILKAFKWRLDDDIEEVKANNEDALNAKYRGFKIQLEMGKSYIHGTDKLGRPVVYINVRLHRPADQDPKALEKFTIYVMETGRLMIQPPVETACLVFDMTGFGLANMDYGFVKFLVQCFEAYYPESLGVLVIHKAPFVFWGVWKIIEPWLDPVVASKIRFTRSDKELTDIIDEEHLPDRFEGGKDKSVYQYIPSTENENSCMKDLETKEQRVDEWKAIMWKFEALTREWVSCNSAEGARSEEVIEAERQELTKELREVYFRMDPHIRARNLYHRSDAPVLQADGSTVWVYSN